MRLLDDEILRKTLMGGHAELYYDKYRRYDYGCGRHYAKPERRAIGATEKKNSSILV